MEWRTMALWSRSVNMGNMCFTTIARDGCQAGDYCLDGKQVMAIPHERRSDVGGASCKRLPRQMSTIDIPGGLSRFRLLVVVVCLFLLVCSPLDSLILHFLLKLPGRSACGCIGPGTTA